MSIPSSTTNKFVHPDAIPEQIRNGRFPYHTTLQSRTETRADLGGIKYTWTNVKGYVDIPCNAYNQLLRQLRAALAEVRTPQQIEELTYWGVLLAGYYPDVQPDWRCVVTELNKIFDIVLVSTDSLQMYTILTCREFEPVAEPGV